MDKYVKAAEVRHLKNFSLGKISSFYEKMPKHVRKSFYVISLHGKLEDIIQEVIGAYRGFRNHKTICNIDNLLTREEGRIIESHKEKEAANDLLAKMVREKEMIPIVCEEFNYPSFFINKKGEIVRRVKSWNKKEERFKYRISTISTFKNGAGYECFSFVTRSGGEDKVLEQARCEQGRKRIAKDRRVYLHRVLACMFIPNPENKKQVNHIDLDKSNNDLENLEWLTPKENLQHARDNGAYDLCFINKKMSPSVEKSIRTKPQGKTVTQHLKDKAEEHGISFGYAQKAYYHVTRKGKS